MASSSSYREIELDETPPRGSSYQTADVGGGRQVITQWSVPTEEQNLTLGRSFTLAIFIDTGDEG